MFQRFVMASTLLASMALSVFTASASELASPEEAEALFTKAVAHVKSVGTETAFNTFNDTEGDFIDRDLYVFCLDYEGKWHAMGAKPSLVGRVAIDLKDKAGKLLVREMIEVSKSPSGKGIVQYTWPNPVTKKVGDKFSFIERVADEMFCGMGYYK